MSKPTLLWAVSQVSSPEKPLLYLFGTMHARDERVLALVPRVQRYIEQAERFATEYELGEGDSEALFHALLLPANQKLSDFFSPSVYAKLGAVLKKQTGYEVTEFEDRKPMVLSNLLVESLFQGQAGMPLDYALSAYAEKLGKPLLGMERFEDQLQTLLKLPLKEQIKPLKTAANNFAKFRRSFEKSTELYLRQDLKQLLRRVKRSTGGMRKILLYGRNRLMAERLLEWTRDGGGTVFCALGAAHLPGSKGVLRLLKEAGLKVRPLKF